MKNDNGIFHLNSDNLADFTRDLFDIAHDTNSNADTIASTIREFMRQGLNMDDILKKTRAALILSRLSGLCISESITVLTNTLKTFDKLTTTTTLNKLSKVDTHFAASTRDLVEALERVGGTARDAGISFNELIALIATTREITTRSGAVIGNALKTIFTRIHQPLTRSQLVFSGVPLVGGESTLEVLTLTVKTYETGSGLQKGYIAEILGGIYQINIVKSILRERELYERIIEICKIATDKAIERNNAINRALNEVS